MSKPLEGVRVVEVAAWTFVPAAGAMLADLGADVIKVEPPTGDPQRGLMNMLNLPGAGVNPFIEIPNRGKRSIALDLGQDSGREVLLKLVESADVFLTSYLPAPRAKLRIDIDDLRAVNPNLIYVLGTGWGRSGPMAETGGYDLAAGWASSGFAFKMTPEGGEPPFQPPAFYDLQGASTIAGAIGTALFKRERSGEAPVVDVSLLNVGMWTMAPDILPAPYIGLLPTPARKTPPSPVTNSYQTGDGRWLFLVLLQADRFWASLCEHLGHPELADDPRFAEMTARNEHRDECVAALEAAFAERTLEEWKERFKTFTGVWAPVQSSVEVHDHPQVAANEYLPSVATDDGSYKIVANPMRFDDAVAAPDGPAPELGQHTEEIMLELGMDWDEIIERKTAGGVA